MTVGLLHPGEMGAMIGQALCAAGHPVVWASAGRSEATAKRACGAGLEDAGTLEEVARRSDVILAVCPPHAALSLARSVPPSFKGIYVDANAVSPATARTIASLVGRCVDGGIVGPPPRKPGSTRLDPSGAEAPVVAHSSTGTIVGARIVSADVGAASALKLAFAAWTKGTSALLLGIRAVARAEGVEQALLDEWEISLHLSERSATAARSALAKGWRWVGEMEEIAETFDAVGLPGGSLHRAAAEIYRRTTHEPADEDQSLERVISALRPRRTRDAAPPRLGRGRSNESRSSVGSSARCCLG